MQSSARAVASRMLLVQRRGLAAQADVRRGMLAGGERQRLGLAAHDRAGPGRQVIVLLGVRLMPTSAVEAQHGGVVRDADLLAQRLVAGAVHRADLPQLWPHVLGKARPHRPEVLAVPTPWRVELNEPSACGREVRGAELLHRGVGPPVPLAVALRSRLGSRSLELPASPEPQRMALGDTTKSAGAGGGGDSSSARENQAQGCHWGGRSLHLRWRRRTVPRKLN
mmetsp:Transcript_103402/g.291945  ORF Transcript_103402/g.291945 Transcript_103402/m.291945 type:complete len:224 (-) Transcript_103402:37-708(-)